MFETFAEWLVARREVRGLTQSALRDALEVRGVRLSGTAVWKWEHGKSHPTASHLEALFDALALNDQERRLQVRKAIDGWAQYPAAS